MMKRPLRDRRARLILFWFLVAFVVVQLMGSLSFDYLMPRVKFAQLHRQLNKLAALEQPWSVVFLGSSRTGTCIVDAEASEMLKAAQGPGAGEVVNMAVSLGDLLCSDAILEKVLAQGHRPQLVVVETCPEFLNVHNGWLEFYLERQLCWQQLPALARELYEAHLLDKTAEYRLLPWYSYRKGFWNAWADEGEMLWDRVRRHHVTYDTATRRREWERMVGVNDRDNAAARERKTLQGLKLAQSCLRDYSVGGQAIQALKRIVERCQQHQCRLILVATPVNSRHRQLHLPALDAAFLNHMAQVTKRYGEFIDAREQLPDERFLDNHHADLDGGVQFTRSFMQQYLLPRYTSRLP